MTQPVPYPDRLSEIERVEIASALHWHFDDPECREELTTQYDIVCAIVDRILLTRAGLFPERSVR